MRSYQIDPDKPPILTRLVPDAPIFMFPAPAAIIYRFADIFSRVWSRMPKKVRGTLLRHWRDGPEYRGVAAPRIAVVADWPRREQAWAYCERDGHEMKFTTYLVETQSSETIALIIAHELAHAWQAATGRLDDLSYAEREDEADRLAEKWCAAGEPFGTTSHPDAVLPTWLWNRRHPCRLREAQKLTKGHWFKVDRPLELWQRRQLPAMWRECLS